MMNRNRATTWGFYSGLLILATLLAANFWGRPTTLGAQITDKFVYLPAVQKSPPPETAELPYVLTKISLPTGSHPHGIDLDPAGQRAFVGNHDTHTMSVINTETFQLVDTILLPEADGANGVGYHPGSDRVFIANRNSNNLSVVDPTAGSFIQNITVGEMPDGVAIQDDYVYVANFGSGNMTLLDAPTTAVLDTIPLGEESRPSLFADNDDRGYVYLAIHGKDFVLVYKDGRWVNSRGNVPSPYGLDFDPVTARLYVANRVNYETLTVLHVNTNTPLEQIVVDQEPYVVGINPRTGHIFAVCGNRVRVYDRRDHALITTIPIGGGAEEGIVVDPARNLVYVTSGDTDEVTVIQDVTTYDLVFTTWRDNGADIFVIDDTGTHEERLTDNGDYHNTEAAWHPNGRRLAFASNRREGIWDIWWMEPNGEKQVNLTLPNPSNQPNFDDREPDWSPDGSQITWSRRPLGGGNGAIWTMDNDSYNKQQLTPDGISASYPKWSPDGEWVAFPGYAAGQSDIYLVSPTDGTLINLTEDKAENWGVSWAPDGSALAFESNNDGDWDVYRADIDDTDNVTITRLTADPADDRFAAWSPDGKRIAFISNREDPTKHNIFVMNANGYNEKRLSDPYPFTLPLVWSPDSRWLVVQNGIVSDAELYKLDIFTGSFIRLTENSYQETLPTWRPDTW